MTKAKVFGLFLLLNLSVNAQNSIYGDYLIDKSLFYEVSDEKEMFVDSNILDSLIGTNQRQELLFFRNTGNYAVGYYNDQLHIEKRLYDINGNQDKVPKSMQKHESSNYIEKWIIYSLETAKVDEIFVIYYSLLPSGTLKVNAERYGFRDATAALNESLQNFQKDAFVYYTIYNQIQIKNFDKNISSELHFQIYFQGEMKGEEKIGRWNLYFPDGKIGKSIIYEKGEIKRVNCYIYSDLSAGISDVGFVDKIVYDGKKEVFYGQNGEIIKKKRYELDEENLPTCQCDLYR